MNIFIVYTNEDLGKDEFNKLISVVQEEKRNKINKFHFYADAQRSLLGDVLVRYAANKIYGVQNKSLIFSTNEYGKPFIVSHPNIQYNISHSGKYVVCAITDESVGIDVEEIKPASLEIAQKFFSPIEYEYLNSQTIERQLECFYTFWTRKESYIKMIGKGLSIPLNSFSVLDNKEYYFRQFIKNNEVVGNICSTRTEHLKCVYIDYAEIIKYF